MATRVAFASLNWGLGHATRDIVFIRALCDAKCSVTVIATGAALRLIRDELGDRCEYLDWPDIPITIDRSPLLFQARMAAVLPIYLRRWSIDRANTNRLTRDGKFDIVISDQRAGVASRHVRTVWITNMLRVTLPVWLCGVEMALERALARATRDVERFLIIDYEDIRITGRMSHDLRYIKPDRVSHIGLVSDVTRQDVEEDIDVFASISGPDPQRAALAERVLEQAHAIDGKVVVTLGKRGEPVPATSPNVEVHDFLPRREQAAMLNRSKLVVARTGLTTLSEIVELGKRALLIPTPGQNEQESNARRLEELGVYGIAPQRGLDLPKQIEIARARPVLTPPWRTDQAIARFLDAVLG